MLLKNSLIEPEQMGGTMQSNFTLAEIKQLNANERINLKTGKAVFEDRFPIMKSTFQVPTLSEEIELIQGLNKSTGREAGIYPEIKNPAFHRKAGKDISKIVLETIKRYGYSKKTDKCIVQCFDIAETRRLRSELGCQTKIVQLIGGVGYQKVTTADGLKSVAEYADGVGPAISYILKIDQDDVKVTNFVTNAHNAGLVVHPYTLRADGLPKQFDTYADFVRKLYNEAKVDGAFTDFPDLTIQALE